MLVCIPALVAIKMWWTKTKRFCCLVIYCASGIVETMAIAYTFFTMFPAEPRIANASRLLAHIVVITKPIVLAKIQAKVNFTTIPLVTIKALAKWTA
jgi:hypothetical protein